MKQRHLVAAALLAHVITPSAFAAGPLVVQASAGISNLQFNVTDLRLEDGVSAAATLVGLGSGKLEVNCCDYGYDSYNPRNLLIQGDRLTEASSSLVALTGGNTGARRTGDGVQVRLGIDEDQFESVSIYRGKFDFNAVGGSANANFSDYRLELTAGTELKITGLSTADLFVDMGLQQVQGDQKPGPAVRTDVSASTFLSVVAASGSSGIEFMSRPDGPEAFAGASLSQTKYEGKVYSSTPNSLSESTSFTYVIRNSSTQTQWVDIGMRARVSAITENVSGYIAPTSAISPVPEPESWALMLAGVIAAGAFARRRRASVAVCAAALLAPVVAQSAPVVGARGSMVAIDAKGEAEASFDVAPQTKPFVGQTNSYFDSSYGSVYHFSYGQAAAQAFYRDDGGLRVYAGGQKSSFAPAHSEAHVELEWTDTVSNINGGLSEASLSFTAFSDLQYGYYYWSLGKTANFRASVWLDGQSDQPVWFTELDHVTTTTGASTTLSGGDMGLSKNGEIRPKDVLVNLGLLQAGETRKVHFKLEMSTSDGYGEMFLQTTAPTLALSPVPEPSAWLLGLLGGAACAALRARARTPV